MKKVLNIVLDHKRVIITLVILVAMAIGVAVIIKSNGETNREKENRLTVTPVTTGTPILSLTNTPVPTKKPTNTPTTVETNIITNTPMPTNTPIPTNTPVSTKKPMPTNTKAPTATPKPVTPTLAVTVTPVPTKRPLEFYETEFEGDCFIGDSRTDGLFMFSGLSTADFVCGVGMNLLTVVEDEKVIEALQNNTYRNIYIQFGVNELGWPSAENFKNKYAVLVNMVKEYQPNAMIYVESVIPLTKEYSESNDVYTNEKVESFNAKLQEMASESGVKYIDIVPVMCGDERVLPAAAGSVDGVHFNNKFNFRWLDAILETR